GWAQEDHAAALRAFQAGCLAAHAPAPRDVCRRARAYGLLDEAASRRFLEANFRPQWVGGDGLLTAYFAPEYPARAQAGGDFTAPVRRKPDDLVMVDLGLFDPALAGKKISGRLLGQSLQPYDDRAAIESTPASAPIAWMKPEDLFFLQIQGSGVLDLTDGRRIKLAYAASNGRPFVGVATILRDQGALADGDASGEAIRRWLSDHRGPQADAVMDRNPRYVFFQPLPPDDREPAGAAGVPLIPGRSLAVDPSLHPMGAVFWIDAAAPALAGAPSGYQRLALALDAGGAIKGPVRADLFIGSGEAAGIEAGRIRHDLSLYELVPVSDARP
ncbi:MAG: MltA domain-containing protein, partial [Caulobacteraceae bacterium]|nr:MltA domain-containing protein [Caulobacteraceae bacterium]